MVNLNLMRLHGSPMLDACIEGREVDPAVLSWLKESGPWKARGWNAENFFISDALRRLYFVYIQNHKFRMLRK